MIYAAIVVVGLVLAAFANWAIYNLAYFPRNIGPWNAAPKGAPERTLPDWIPVLGWLRLQREFSLHGRWFWVRPFLIECGLPLFLCWLYRYELAGGLLAEGPMQTIVTEPMRWLQFCSHGFLILLLLVATCIDLDERCIPDTITLPGTLLALLGAAIFPNWHLAYLEPNGAGAFVARLHPGSPYAWNPSWNGSVGLWLALLSFSVWCFALADRRWITRRGWRKAIEYFLAGLVRHWSWMILLGIWIAGMIAIGLAHSALPKANWQSLFSSLIGLTLGGSIVWFVRVVSRYAMRMEAMGFGDVTLMAMVGAFLGWQTVWLSFFAAAFIAAGLVLLIWVVTRDSQTPFGPYLALGTVVVLLGWNSIWNEQAIPRILVIGGPYLFWSFLSFLVLLGGSLWAWLRVKEMLLRQ